MNVERFTTERRARWNELESLVERARRKPERLPPNDVLRLGSLYRSASADLAYARRAFRAESVVGRLERLVIAARPLVYDAGPRRTTLRSFFARDYWVAVRERPVLLAAGAVLLFAPAAAAVVWAALDPDQAAGVVPRAFGGAARRMRPGEELGIPAAEGAAFSSAIFTNNIRVTFLAFAGGIAFGLGTSVVLVFNGIVLGVVAGLALSAGSGIVLVELIAPHGVLELSCIVVTAAAGLRMGWALVDPGVRPRGVVLVEEARRAVEIVLGTVPWLVVAGLIEGLITPAGFGLAGALAIGFGVAALYWTLVVTRGAPIPSDVRSSVTTGVRVT